MVNYTRHMEKLVGCLTNAEYGEETYNANSKYVCDTKMGEGSLNIRIEKIITIIGIF